METFLNYFASKMSMILLNISQSATIYLFEYCVSHITVIPHNDKFLYKCNVMWIYLKSEKKLHFYKYL